MSVFAEKKTVNYKKVEQFIAEYYNAYNLYAQDMETIDLMDEYWAPEFVSMQYLPIPECPLIMDLTTWKYFLVGAHLNLLETLNLEEVSIDTKKLSVVARVNLDFNDRTTGALVLNVDCIAYYNLKVDKKNKIQIICLKLYLADPYALMAISPQPPAGM
jgi:hypothetical protein